MSIETSQRRLTATRLSQRSRLSWPSRFVGKIVSLLFSVVMFHNALSVPVQPQAANEYQVKAAFLYNFAKFVEWPAEVLGESSKQLVVGIMGDDPFGSAIDQTISGKTVNGRSLIIRRLKWGQNLRDCHILFIAASERKRLAQILESLKGASVLTISELDSFNHQGGIINFILEENKVRFEINTESAEQAKLKISSKLLTLAKGVISGQRAGRN